MALYRIKRSDKLVHAWTIRELLKQPGKRAQSSKAINAMVSGKLLMSKEGDEEFPSLTLANGESLRVSLEGYLVYDPGFKPHIDVRSVAYFAPTEFGEAHRPEKCAPYLEEIEGALDRGARTVVEIANSIGIDFGACARSINHGICRGYWSLVKGEQKFDGKPVRARGNKEMQSDDKSGDASLITVRVENKETRSRLLGWVSEIGDDLTCEACGRTVTNLRETADAVKLCLDCYEECDGLFFDKEQSE